MARGHRHLTGGDQIIRALEGVGKIAETKTQEQSEALQTRVSSAVRHRKGWGKEEKKPDVGPKGACWRDG